MRLSGRRLTIVVAAFLATPVPAADGQAAFEACAALQNDAERLRCYDRAMQSSRLAAATAVPAAPAPEPVAHEPKNATAPESAAESAAAPSRFGLDDEQGAEEEVDRIDAALADIDVQHHGERIFSLDNGQVWRETAPTPRLRVEVGDAVSIRSGLFGSYRLFGSGSISTRVERIR